MTTIKSKLESCRLMGPDSKIFFLRVIEETDDECRLLGGIFELGKASEIEHARIDRLIEELDNPLKQSSLDYIVLKTPGLDTTSVARGVLRTYEAMKDLNGTMELTVGSVPYITGFRFSIPITDHKPSVLETRALLELAQLNASSFKQQEESEGEKEDLTKIQFERFVWEESQVEV